MTRNSGSFKKGRAKTGGRKKGTSNKGDEWRSAVRTAVDELREVDEDGKAAPRHAGVTPLGCTVARA